LDWKENTPCSAPGDWVFASPATAGKRPFWLDSMLANYIQPIAEPAGLGHIGGIRRVCTVGCLSMRSVRLNLAW